MKNLLLSLLLLAASQLILANEPIDLLQLAIPDSAEVAVPTPSKKEDIQSTENNPEWDWKTQRHSISYSVGTPNLLSFSSGGLVTSLTWIFSLFDNTSHTIRYHTVGTHALHYRWNARRWLRIGGNLSYCNTVLSDYDQHGTGEETIIHEIATIGKVDFTYINRRSFKLYSGIGVGVGITWGHSWEQSNGEQTESTMGKAMPTPHFAITPIGMEFGGDHVFGVFETNIGTVDLVHLGIGYHF